MTGLPRSIIKKYGVSKKAWAVFRGSRSQDPSGSRGSKTMARRFRKRSRGKSSGLSMNNILIGAGAVAFVEPWIDQLTANFAGSFLGGLGDDVIKAGIGYYAAKKGKGIVKGAGIALLVTAVRNVTASLAGNVLRPQTAQTGVF